MLGFCIILANFGAVLHNLQLSEKGRIIINFFCIKPRGLSASILVARKC